MQCENDKALKEILKSRLYTKKEDVMRGDWIYFKNEREWEGPVRVTAIDGKTILAIRAGKLLHINTDYVTVIKTGRS